MNYAPRTHLLKALASQNLDWKTALGELIDNSLDADAKNVQIIFDEKRTLTVVDDGVGCASPEAIIILGDHRDHKTTKLGRYGVGATDAFLWCGGERSTVDVRTIHAGKRLMLSVNWENLANAGWAGDAPTVFDAIEPGEIGTRITVAPVVKDVPHGESWNRLIREIGYIYAPALKAGVQITVKPPRRGARPAPVQRWTFPEMEPDHVDAMVAVGNRTARVTCGIVKEGHGNPRPGLTYCHKFRVILPSSSRGCGEFGIGRVCGFVELDASWTLAKNKTDIVSDREKLEAEIYRVLRPLLERAEQVGSVLECEAIATEVSERLNAMLGRSGTARAKRGEGEKSGAAEPTGEGSPHQRAAREQSGNRFQSRASRAPLRVSYVNEGDCNSIGKLALPNVLLNRDNKAIAFALETKNTLAMLFCAAALLGVQHCFMDRNEQRLLRGLERSDFAAAMGGILSSDLRLDGRPALASVVP
jgi:Histidine kinase-, DNA gyrase B-, and HSP90-like ATPase